KLVLLLVVGI
ncbi:DNA gyrase/topoisomerase IV, subunit A family protein, partial [Vibrio parahaemolyticus VP2007-007]